MTAAQFERRVRFWQRKLEPLGLRHWLILVSKSEEPLSHNDGPIRASVTASSYYDTAWIVYHPDSLGDAREADMTIIHELLHLVFRDYDASIHLVDAFVPYDALNVWEDGLEHALEGVIERLARTLYALFED